MAIIKGKWKWNAVLSMSTDKSSGLIRNITGTFSSNGEEFTAIRFSIPPTSTGAAFSIYYISSAPFTVYTSSTHTWTNENYRTIDFGTAEVTMDDEIYALFIANASQPIEVPEEYNTKAINLNQLKRVYDNLNNKISEISSGGSIDTTNLVTLDGDQTIDGAKSFNNLTMIVDTYGDEYSITASFQDAFDANGGTSPGWMVINATEGASSFFKFPELENEVKTLATQEWVRAQGYGNGGSIDTSNLVTLDGVQTVTGAKSFNNLTMIAATAGGDEYAIKAMVQDDYDANGGTTPGIMVNQNNWEASGFFKFPELENEVGTLATREWVQAQGYGSGGSIDTSFLEVKKLSFLNPANSVSGWFGYGQPWHGSVGLTCSTSLGANTFRASSNASGVPNQSWAEYGSNGITLPQGYLLSFPSQGGRILTNNDFTYDSTNHILTIKLS